MVIQPSGSRGRRRACWLARPWGADLDQPVELRGQHVMRVWADRRAGLGAAGASEDEVAATIDKDARARWSAWDNPEWINFAARAFCHATRPA